MIERAAARGLDGAMKKRQPADAGCRSSLRGAGGRGGALEACRRASRLPPLVAGPAIGRARRQPIIGPFVRRGVLAAAHYARACASSAIPLWRSSASMFGSRPRNALNESIAGRLPPTSRISRR